MKIYSGGIQVISVTATSEATGYAAANIANPRILHSWRSTSTAAQTVTIDLGADSTIAGVALNAVNFSSVTVATQPAGGAWSAETAITVGADANGRKKGSVAITATARYVRFTLSGTPDDAYFEIGAAYVFSATATRTNPDNGMTLTQTTPQASAVLANGRTFTASTGPARTTIDMRFSENLADDASAVRRLARAGTIWVDLGVVETNGLQWPVSAVEDAGRLEVRIGQSTASFVLDEVV